jgi:hypothetical protein
MFTPVPAAIVTLNATFPVIPLSEAVTEVAPDATAVASPEELIVATDGFETAHAAVEVMFAVEPSL